MKELRRIYIDGEETKYSITKDGKVFSDYSNRFLKPFKASNGYWNIDLYINGKNIKKGIHQLVAIAWIPNPKKLPTVNHKDGDKDNYTANNLEWATQRDNILHAYREKLHKPISPEKCPFTKYKREQIETVCLLLEKGFSGTVIEEKTGVNTKVIYDVKNGRLWKSVSKAYNIPKNLKFKADNFFTSIEKEEMYNMIIMGFDDFEIMNKLKIDDSLKKKCKEKLNYIRYYIKYKDMSSTTIDSSKECVE